MTSDQPYCSATVYGPRVQSWGCQRRGVVQRNGKLFCRQHDPEAVKVRLDKRQAVWKSEERKHHSIEAEAESLAKQLGCGRSHWYNAYRGQSGYTSDLLLSFAEVKGLIERLQTKDTAT